ncbi:hypothetical protein H5410_051509 [Solanum commersonii]|uniref:Amine oxidase domain-containing protein n=1 Tax=Solanum commersonii TaxID=4109 RepID=A0A9J5WYM6_SOLCO|nr:hypothetical protein H5410_051509 [Solanum commersonii]
MEGVNKATVADLGRSVLTGTLENPHGLLARQLSYTLHKVSDQCPLYRAGGKFKASKLRQELSQIVPLGWALETLQKDFGVVMNDKEMILFNWHLENLEFANAGLLSQLSLAFWDQDNRYDMGGDHFFFPSGNERLVHAMAENVPIILKKIMYDIRYGRDSMKVITAGQLFEGYDIVHRSSQKFEEWFYLVHSRGSSAKAGPNKKIEFWTLSGEFFLFYTYATAADGLLLLALVAGEIAHKFETMTSTDAVTKVLQILKVYINHKDSRPKTHPNCIYKMGNCGGKEDFFFAGEATTGRYPATMHGAFLTGLREAAKMAHNASVRTLHLQVKK